MVQKHAGVIALGLLIGAFVGHLLYEVLLLSPVATALAPAASQTSQVGAAFNANPHPDCRGATWPDIPQKCLTRSSGNWPG